MADSTQSSPAQNPETPPAARGRGWVKLAAFVALAVAAGLLYWRWGDRLTVAALAERESQFRAYLAENPALACGAAFLIYAAVTGLSFPGAAGLTLVIAWFFGFWRSLVLVSFASTTGATLAFLLSRYFLRDLVQRRFGSRLEAFDRALEREGAFYLFTLRLIPAVPFFVINLVMGLTPMRAWTYWWVSQVGMLPGTAVYVYAGSQFPDLATIEAEGARGILTPEVITAFLVLGVFPLAMRTLFRILRRGRAAKTEPHPGS